MRLDRPILLLSVAETIVWAGMFYIFPALILRWETEFGWSKAELTGAFSAAIAVSACCSPFVGRLIDRGYGPTALVGGSVAGGLLVGLLSTVDSLPAFYAIWLAIGAAMSASLYEPCFALVTRARGMSAKRSITWITLVAGFAGTVSFPTAHAIAETADWRAACQFFALAICVLAAPMMFFGAGDLERQRAAQAKPAPAAAGLAELVPPQPKPFLRNPAFWLLAAAFSLMAVTHGVVLNHLLPMLKERGVAADVAVLAASCIGPMQVTGRIVMMAVERHVSNFAVMSFCFAAVATAVTLLIGSAAAPALLIGFVVLQGSGYGVTSIMKPVVTRDILGDKNFGAMSGAMALPYLGAFAVAPFLGALLWEVGGYDFVLKAMVGTALAGLACFLKAAWDARRI